MTQEERTIATALQDQQLRTALFLEINALVDQSQVDLNREIAEGNFHAAAIARGALQGAENVLARLDSITKLLTD